MKSNFQAKLKRLERAKALLKEGKVWPVVGTEWFIAGQNGKYLINPTKGTCTCPDFSKRKDQHKGWCKHRLAVWLLTNHPDDWETYQPPQAQEDEIPQVEAHHHDQHGRPVQVAELEEFVKQLVEILPQELLEFLVAYGNQELQDRDYRRGVANEGSN